MKKLISICQAATLIFSCAALPARAQVPVVGEAAPSGFGNFSPKIFGVAEQDPIIGGAAPLGLASASPAISVVDVQYPVAAVAAAYVPFSSDALDQLVRPIALYPDPLLADIFAAATVPAQIVLADRYVNGGGDLSQIEAQPWDPSVQALAHYPTVLKWLDDNLPWTTEVGDAFLNQQEDVMASIQRLRLLAESQGNLPSTPEENVVTDSGTVEIEPANPEFIYVPVYPWNTIYYDRGVFCSFGVGFPIGLWLTHDWDWHNHHLIVWGAGHSRPANWWSQPPRNRVASRGVTVWHAPVRTPGGVAGGVAGRADRGFAAETARPVRLTAPSTPAPLADRPGTVPGSLGGRAGTVPGLSSGRAGTVPGPSIGRAGEAPGFSTEIGRGAAPSSGARADGGVISLPSVSRPAPEVRAPSVGSAFGGGGAFGGSESSSEARQSSMRGVESRSTISAPAPAPAARPSEPPAPAPASRRYEPPASSGSSGRR